jgi:anti-anti-sigma factor
MNAHDLTVSTTLDGPVCVLTVAGDLDATMAARLAEEAALAEDVPAERFVWDLSELAFLDCAGARALSEATLTVPAGRPVLVRSASRPVRHLMELLDLDLERLPPRTAAP